MDPVLLQRAPVALFAADRDGTCTFVTDALCADLGADRTALVGRRWRDVIPAADVELVDDEGHGTIGVLVRGPVLDLAATPSEHDELTGLLTAGAIADYLQRSLEEAAEGVGPVSVGVLHCQLRDVDDVRALGPDALDELVGAVAGRLRGAVRFCDAVGRAGDDAFVVLAEQEDDPAAIERVADRLVELLERPFRLHGGSVRISGGIGVAVGDGTSTARSLLRAAAGAAAQTAEGATSWRRADGLRLVR